METRAEVPQELKLELSYDPAVLFLGVHPGKPAIHTDTCAPGLTAALITIGRTRRQPGCPSADGWIRKSWHPLGTHPEKTITERRMCPRAHRSTDYNRQDTEAAWVSISRRMDTEIVVHIYNGILLSYQKECI